MFLFTPSMNPGDYQGILVKNVINKIAFIFKEKTSDKKFADLIMKVLKLSLMRNGPASREYFTLLSPSLQNKVFDFNKLIDYAEKNEPDILHLLNEDMLEEDQIKGLEVSDEEISYDKEDASEEDEEETDETEHANYMKSSKPSNIRNSLTGHHVNPMMKEPQGAMLKNSRKLNEEPLSSKTQTRGESSKDIPRPKSNVGSPALKSKAEQIDVSEVEQRKIPKIAATLDAMKQHIAKLRSAKLTTELKNYDIRCYPYLLAVLALNSPEVHSQALQAIVSTLDHFESGSEAYVQLAGGLLDQFAYQPSVGAGDQAIELLQDCLSLLQQLPCKPELFRLLQDRVEAAEPPALQLYLKIAVNLLASTADGPGKGKKPFHAVLGRLVAALAALINHENAEVRKSTVLTLVELSFLVDSADFDAIMQQFNQSQKRLVQIYIEKKLGKH